MRGCRPATPSCSPRWRQFALRQSLSLIDAQPAAIAQSAIAQARCKPWIIATSTAHTGTVRALFLVRQRIGAQLEVHRERQAALATFVQPRRAIAARRPQSAAFPAGI